MGIILTILSLIFWGSLSILAISIQLDILIFILWLLTGGFNKGGNFLKTVSLTAGIFRWIGRTGKSLEGYLNAKGMDFLKKLITTVVVVFVIILLLWGFGFIQVNF